MAIDFNALDELLKRIKTGGKPSSFAPGLNPDAVETNLPALSAPPPTNPFNAPPMPDEPLLGQAAEPPPLMSENDALKPFTPTFNAQNIPGLASQTPNGLPANPIAVQPVEPPNLPPSLMPSQTTQAAIETNLGRDYGQAQYNPDGTIKQKAGKDRDTEWSLGEKAAGFGLGLADAVMSGRGLIAGLPKAFSNASDRNFLEKRRDAAELANLYPRLKQQQDAEKFNLGQEAVKFNIEDKRADNLRQSELGNRRAQTSEDSLEFRKTALNLKEMSGQVNSTLKGIIASKYYKPGENPTIDKQLADNKIFLQPYDHQLSSRPGEESITIEINGTPLTTTMSKAGFMLSNIAKANAGLEQDTTKFNASKQLEVDKQNVSSQLTYQNQVVQALTALGNTEAELTAYGGTAAGLRSTMDANIREANGLLAQMNEINGKDYTDTPEAEIKKADEARKDLQTRYNKLADNFNGDNQKLYSELGKTEAGKIKAEQIRQRMPKMPPRLSFTPIKAAKVSSGIGGKYSGQSFKLSDIRGAFADKSDAEIKQIIENNGGSLNN